MWPFIFDLMFDMHARGTKFNCVFAENFYKLLIWWKMFTNYIDEYSLDIGFYGLFVWWFEQNSVTLSFLFVLIILFGY